MQLSEFMKSVVQEVMKPKQKPKENPLFSLESRFLYSKPTENNQDIRRHIRTVPGINRPNYQRDNMEKRLSVLGVDTTAKTKQVFSKKSDSLTSTQATKSFVEGPLAKLQTISLVQGNISVESDQAFSPVGKNHLTEESQLIGQTRDGVKAWLFTSLHLSLQNSFQRPLKTNSIGVIVSEKCTAGQLVLLNDVLRENAAIKYCLTWDKENKQNFELELYENDSSALLKAVKTIFQQLSKNAYKQIQSYKVHSPSSWLTKQLGLKTHTDGVAVVEGIDYYTAILLLDRYMKKSPANEFGYEIEKNYLLLHGNYDVVSQASDEIQKQAERIK